MPLINAILYQFARPVSSFEYITVLNVITYIYSLAALIIGGINFNKSYRKNLFNVIDKNHLLFADSSESITNNIVKKTQPSPTTAIIVLLVYAILMLVVTAIAPSAQQLSQAPFIILSDGTVVFLEEYETGEMLPNAEREKRIAKIDQSLLHTQTESSSSTNSLEYIAVTAKDLSNAYADNRIAADQLSHELVLIGKSTDISDEISRIKLLMQPDEMAVELGGAFKEAARKIMAEFPSFSELYESIKYEKNDFNSGMSFFEKLIERDNLTGEIEIDADKAWDKLNDALIDGLETLKDKCAYEIECLLRRKCGVPIELILKEIEEKLIGIV